MTRRDVPTCEVLETRTGFGDDNHVMSKKSEWLAFVVRYLTIDAFFD